MILLAAALAATSIRFPAEFEPQASVWLSWPTYDHKRGVPVARTTLDIVNALTPTVAVDLLVRDAREEATARRGLKQPGRVRFHRSDNAEIWARDYGPIFLQGTDRKLQVADYRFTFWGYRPPGDPLAAAEDGVEPAVARTLGLPIRQSRLVSEGGNREFNGCGTMLCVAAVERARNPGWSLQRIAAEHRRVLGVRNVVWLPYGVMEDDHTDLGPLPGGAYTVVTTGGHVDNVARFADARTVLLAEITEADARRSPIARESRRRLELDLKALRRARDENGRPFRIVRMPTPDLRFDTMGPGDAVYDFIQDLKYAQRPFPKGRRVRVVLAASYMNFLVSNGVVLATNLWKPGRPASTRRKDARANAILARAFPGRRVVAIDSEPVNLGGGGIHCVTQQQPSP